MKKDRKIPTPLIVVFRCDASQSIGVGHVMRCLILADALTQQGAKCIFATIHETLNVVPDVKRRGYQTISPESLAEINPNFVVIDHYHLDRYFFLTLKKMAIPCMMIDDICEQPFYPCDLLLVHNLAYHEEDYRDLVPKGCRIFSGAEFILINPEFLALSDNRPEVKTPVETLFLFFGGTDPAQLTLRVLRIIEQYNISVPTIDVVIGEGNRGGEEIKKLCQLLKANLHIQIDNMAEVMARADLAVGCGGTAIWERLSLRIPTLEISHSQWQIPTFKALHKQENLYYLGEESVLSDVDIASHLIRALTEGLNFQYCACGGGEKKVAKEVMAMAIKTRKTP